MSLQGWGWCWSREEPQLEPLNVPLWSWWFCWKPLATQKLHLTNVSPVPCFKCYSSMKTLWVTSSSFSRKCVRKWVHMRNHEPLLSSMMSLLTPLCCNREKQNVLLWVVNICKDMYWNANSLYMVIILWTGNFSLPKPLWSCKRNKEIIQVRGEGRRRQGKLVNLQRSLLHGSHQKHCNMTTFERCF